ncbi:MAG TPA: delta-60 repeat domain-containing protein [Actinomycetota bacterium]
MGIQSDGKIVAVGYTTTSAHVDFALARYRSTGALDSTFGSGGIVTTDISSYDDLAWAMAIQSDGKIVAAGTSSNTTEFGLARYLAS